MLHISPTVFQVLLDLIQEHPILCNHSNNPQTPVQTQLAVTLYCMGHYGNGAYKASIERQEDLSLVLLEISHHL